MPVRSEQALRARRTQLRAQWRERRNQTRAKLQSQPLYRRRERRRRLRLLVALAVLWLLLRQCNSPEAPSPPPDTSEAPEQVDLPPRLRVPRPAAPTQSPTTRSRLRTRQLPRAEYRPPPPQPEPWLSELRLQVAARSPMLARCFEGAERSGALHWTARIDLQRGVVSDHELTPTLAGTVLTDAMKSCVREVLSTPRYRFNDQNQTTMTPRVSMVLEF